jgi:hypothetical protein
MIHSKGEIQYGTATIPYHIIKSKRVKISEIIVDSDKVAIRTPLDKKPDRYQEDRFRQGFMDTKKTERIQRNHPANHKTDL